MVMQNRGNNDSGTSAASQANQSGQPIVRVRIWYALLLCIMAIFIIRLFYLQIIRYSHYKTSAFSDQFKQYQIPATRGAILAHDGNDATTTIPIVLNQKLYDVFADPLYVKYPDKAAIDVAKITGGNANDYAIAMRAKTGRYSVLAKKVSQTQQTKILNLKYQGIGTQAHNYRTYPQGSLGAQVLGFVNDAGNGTYGIEQSLDALLKGTPGELRAITDVHGVPLAASAGNTRTAATPGQNVVLTIDIPMQKRLEQILADGVKKAQSPAGSAVIIDVSNGSVKAMANVPTYDPAKYYDESDNSVFGNAAVTKSIEVGSIMKTLTTAAALDSGAIKPTQTYYDPSKWKVDGFNITNIEEDGGAGTRSIADILNLSLNTGVTWELMQMGGGMINQKARDTWHDYMTNHYGLGKPTGIEQGYESAGYVPAPKDNGAAIDLTYANTAFGQAMTATPLQMAAALGAVVNGGTYYQPRLIDGTVDSTGVMAPQPSKVTRRNVVSPAVSQQIIPLLQNVIDKHNVIPAFDQSRYIVGGKTGTAQIEKNGKYLENDFNGTYLGFVGGDKPQYAIAIFVYQPKVHGYAGTAAAQPIFADTGHMLINNSYVKAKN